MAKLKIIYLLNPPTPILLYDGDCAWCSAAVQWVLHHERYPTFYFAPLQAPWVQEWLPTLGFPEGFEEAVVVYDGQKVHVGMDAICRILQEMSPGWRMLGRAIQLFPSVVRTMIYRKIARCRWRLRQKGRECVLPPPHLRHRFVMTR